MSLSQRMHAYNSEMVTMTDNHLTKCKNVNIKYFVFRTRDVNIKNERTLVMMPTKYKHMYDCSIIFSMCLNNNNKKNSYRTV